MSSDLQNKANSWRNDRPLLILAWRETRIAKIKFKMHSTALEMLFRVYSPQLTSIEYYEPVGHWLQTEDVKN